MQVATSRLTIIRHILGLLLLCSTASLLESCKKDKGAETQTKTAFIGQELWPPCEGGDSLPATWTRLIHRIRPSTEVVAMLSSWPDTVLQDSLLEAMRRVGDARLQLYLAPSLLEKEKALGQPWWAAANEPASRVNILPAATETKANFLVFHSLAPRAHDDGLDGVLFLNSPDLLHPRHPSLSQAMWVHGDSILAARFRVFAATDPTQLTSTEGLETHTYSNLHDHLVHFFPDPAALEPAMDFLERLDEAEMATRKPAKLRLCLSALDACHAPFSQYLATLITSFEIDARIVLPARSEVAWRAIRPLIKLGPDRLRTMPLVQDGNVAVTLPNLMMLDGPIALEAGGPVESRRMAYLFSSGWDTRQLKNNQSVWIRVANQEVAEELELQFERIWATAQEATPPPSSFSRRSCQDQ